MSSFKQAKPEQLYCCFNKDPNKTVRSVKFVPKEESLKVPAGKYHESNSQAIIHERMVNLHKSYKLSGGGKSQILSKRLQNLINSGQRSFMNISKKNNVKRRNTKILNKQRSRSNTSSTRNSFARTSNQSMFTYTQKPSKTFKGNKPGQYSLIRPAISGNVRIARRSFTAYNEIKKNKLAKREVTREKQDKAESKDNKEAAVESLDIRDKLDDLTLSLKDDLMSIDGSLREKLNVMQNKHNKPLKQNKRGFGEYSEDYESEPYHEKLNLMPIQRKPSALSQIIDHSKRLQSGEEESFVGVVPKVGMNTDRPEMYKKHSTTKARPITTSSDNRRFDFKFMKVNEVEPYFSSLQENNPDDHIIQITTKDAADADGVYYAP